MVVIINTEKAFQNAEELTKESSSSEIFKRSLTLLKFTKRNWLRKITLLIIECLAAGIIARQYSTIQLTKDIAEILISVIVALIAIVFTGYAFFQALINDRLLITLLSLKSDQDANLAKTNEYFAEVMTIQITCLIVDVLVVVFSTIIPSDWCLFQKNSINEGVAFFMLLCFLIINVESILEMRSFIFNVYQLYNLHAYSRIVDIKEKERISKENTEL